MPFPMLPTGKAMQRLDKFPLDPTSVQDSMENAILYAQSPTAYPGQPVAVLIDGAQKLFIIDEDGSLKQVGKDGTTMNYYATETTFPAFSLLFHEDVLYYNIAEITTSTEASPTQDDLVGDGWAVVTDSFTASAQSGNLLQKVTDGWFVGNTPLSAEEGNLAEYKADGLFVTAPDCEISEEAGNVIVLKEDGLFAPPGLDPISEEAGNALERKADGLFVPPGLDPISDEPNNALERKADGLYVSPGLDPLSTEEGNIISRDAAGLYATERVSAEEGNIITREEDGLYAIAPDAALTENITATGTSIGGITDGQTLPLGMTLTEYIKMVHIKMIPPVYVGPTLSASASGTKDVEAGSTVTTTVSGTFNQHDGGALSEYRISKNGSVVFTGDAISAQAITPFVIGQETVGFQASADFAEGPIKNDNLGQPYPTGQITAGTANSSTINFNGKRMTFYGADSVTVAPATSAEVRALTGSVLGSANGSTFNVTVPAGSRRVVIAYPSVLRSPTSILYVEQGNADYKDLFPESLIEVEGADSYAGVEYRMMTYLLAIPNEATMTFKVTI